MLQCLCLVGHLRVEELPLHGHFQGLAQPLSFATSEGFHDVFAIDNGLEFTDSFQVMRDDILQKLVIPFDDL